MVFRWKAGARCPGTGSRSFRRGRTCTRRRADRPTGCRPGTPRKRTRGAWCSSKRLGCNAPHRGSTSPQRGRTGGSRRTSPARRRRWRRGRPRGSPPGRSRCRAEAGTPAPRVCRPRPWRPRQGLDSTPVSASRGANAAGCASSDLKNRAFCFSGRRRRPGEGSGEGRAPRSPRREIRRPSSSSSRGPCSDRRACSSPILSRTTHSASASLISKKL